LLKNLLNRIPPITKADRPGSLPIVLFNVSCRLPPLKYNAHVVNGMAKTVPLPDQWRVLDE